MHEHERAAISSEAQGYLLQARELGLIDATEYELIIDRQAAPYARPDLDLTEQVVQMYNSGDAGDSGGGDEKKDAKAK